MLEKIYNYVELTFGTFLGVVIGGFALGILFVAFIIYLLID